METTIASDRAKINKWGDICVSQDWATQGELEKWLFVNGILFTQSGSCMNSSLLTNKLATIEAAEGASKVCGAEEMATYVLRVLTGQVIFTSTEIEKVFWKGVVDRLLLEFELVLPLEIMPKYVREELNYRDTTETIIEPPAQPKPEAPNWDI
jgi:hypothetical protein